MDSTRFQSFKVTQVSQVKNKAEAGARATAHGDLGALIGVEGRGGLG
jgi:hypothetical protein